MNTLLISYKLDLPGNHQPLIDRIKSFGRWLHPLDAIWIIQTERTSAQVRDALREYMEMGDELLVLNVTGRGWATTGFSNEANAWLKNYVTGVPV